MTATLWPWVGDESPRSVRARQRAEHEAWSARRTQPIVDELLAELAAVAPWTTVGAFAGTVRAWATAEARSRLLGEYLDERGLLDDAGVPLPAVALAERFERQAATLRAQLALTPMTWAQLRRTTADIDGGDVIDIKAGLRDAGRRILEAKEAAELAAATGQDGGDE